MSDKTYLISVCESARENLVTALTNSPNPETREQVKKVPSVEQILQQVRLEDNSISDKKYFISSVVESYVGDLNIDQGEKRILVKQVLSDNSQE